MDAMRSKTPPLGSHWKHLLDARQAGWARSLPADVAALKAVEAPIEITGDPGPDDPYVPLFGAHLRAAYVQRRQEAESRLTVMRCVDYEAVLDRLAQGHTEAAWAVYSANVLGHHDPPDLLSDSPDLDLVRAPRPGPLIGIGSTAA